ncbi:MAG: EamA family transporter [Clostridiales bacterium]|nr:EamA family transporter [Clostridiales bacterium]
MGSSHWLQYTRPRYVLYPCGTSWYPIFAAPLAVIWLGEKITPVFIIGAIIIAVGVFIAEVKKKRYNSNL